VPTLEKDETLLEERCRGWSDSMRVAQVPFDSVGDRSEYFAPILKDLKKLYRDNFDINQRRPVCNAAIVLYAFMLLTHM
jgi:hypothetical protein